MNENISLLLNRRSSLENEVMILSRELNSKKDRFELRNNIQNLWDGLRNRNGNYQRVENLPDFETKWKESFFVKHRLIAEKYSGYTLSKRGITKAKEEHIEQPFRDEEAYIYVQVVVFVEAIIPTSTGIALKLSDPFGSILTDPLKNTSLEDASTWINRIIVAHIGFNYHKNNYPLKGFKLLKFSLYEDLRNYVTNNNQINK